MADFGIVFRVQDGSCSAAPACACFEIQPLLVRDLHERWCFWNPPPLPAPPGRSNNSEKSTPASRAKRDFNRAAMRERSKWERETVSNTPDRGFSSSTAPSWGGSNARKGGTYAVATLMVAWAGLRSTPPQAEQRKGAWFWQDGGSRNDDDRDVGYSVVNRCEEHLLFHGGTKHPYRPRFRATPPRSKEALSTEPGVQCAESPMNQCGDAILPHVDMSCVTIGTLLAFLLLQPRCEQSHHMTGCY